MINDSVSVSLLIPIMKTLVFEGYDWEAFCRYASIDPKVIEDVEARIDEDEFEGIVQAAAIYTGDEAFGLHQGQAMSLFDLGALGYVMLHSKTIGEAVGAYRKYNVIVSSGFDVDMDIQRGDAVFRLFLNNPLKTYGRHCIEDMTASFYQTMLKLSRRPIPLKEIRFMHGQSIEMQKYVSVLGIEPLFNRDSNTIRFNKEILDYPVLGADQRLLGVFESIAEEARTKLIQGSVLTGELSRWIIECMPSYFPTLQDAAKRMQMSVRTLQARLKQENTSYNRLANVVRKELACSYLRKPEYNIGEIAYLLHYSEPSAFQNAFRKWTGTAPGEYRQRLKTNPYISSTPS